MTKLKKNGDNNKKKIVTKLNKNYDQTQKKNVAKLNKKNCDKTIKKKM